MVNNDKSTGAVGEVCWSIQSFHSPHGTPTSHKM